MPTDEKNYLDIGFNALLIKREDTLVFALGGPVQSDPSNMGSVEEMSVKSSISMNDLWINNAIRSNNWKPKKVGFMLDGQRGYGEFVDVYISGTIIAIAGTIGGWSINATSIYTGTEDFTGYTANAGDMTIYSNGVISSIHAYNFYIDSGGIFNTRSGIMNGVSIATIPNDTLTDISIMEKSHDLVFSVTDADTIAWSVGTIVMSNGRTFSIAAGNTGNMVALSYIYLDPDVSTTVLQVTTTYSTAMGANKVLLGMAQNNAVTAMFIPYGAGQPLISGANIGALSIFAGNIAASTITAGKMSVSTLSSITANIGAITAGTIDGVVITGGTFQTVGDAGGERVVITSSDTGSVSFYYNTTLYGYIQADRISASESYVKIETTDGNGISMNTGVGASGYNDVQIYANGGTFSTDGNATNTYISMSTAAGSVGIAHEPSHTPNDYAFCDMRFEFSAGVFMDPGATSALTITAAGITGAFTSKISNTGDAPALWLVNSSNTYGTLLLTQGGTSAFIYNDANSAQLTKAGVWTDASSRRYKENFEKISVLDKLKELDILKYNYIVDGKKDKNDSRVVEKHFTPIAEDLYRVFGFGNDMTISPSDTAGIALQAIKELIEEIELLKAEIRERV